MRRCARPEGRAHQDPAQNPAYRIRHGNVGDDAFAKKRGDARFGEVDELVGNHDIARMDIFFQAAHCADGYEPLHAQLFESMDVGAEGNLMRQKYVPASMPGQKRDPLAGERAQNVGGRGHAVGRIERAFFHIAQLRHLIEAAAADDPDFRFSHLYNLVRHHFTGAARSIPFSISASAICTAFSAAPFLRLSATTHRLSVFSRESSRRIRPTYTGSSPSASLGMG